LRGAHESIEQEVQERLEEQLEKLKAKLGLAGHLWVMWGFKREPSL